MRIILPAAGLGTRMNMDFNKSKEMLPDPITGVPLIHKYILKEYNPLIITRKEKTDLIEYCKNQGIETLIIEPEGEWPNTILKSESKWTTNNLLILPDTVFTPMTSTINNIQNMLVLGNTTVLALHNVEDVSKWGRVHNYTITEKPTEPKSGRAWGLIGFKHYEGRNLFNAMTKRNTPYYLEDAGFIFLDSFKDLTRTGKIE